jgi:hypothetical protein
VKCVTLMATTAAFLVLPGVSLGSNIYSENFDADHTANWTVNDPGDTDTLADFFYDYSAIGVPPAPGGSTTRGLKMTANNTDGVFGGFSVSPTGENFQGKYKVTFDLWQNYVGPVGPGGSGTTQLSEMGIETAGNVGVWPGSSPKESLMFGVTLDGGSSVDYRVYSSANTFGYPEGDPVFSSGGFRNGSDSYYAGLGGESAPGDQVTLYPGQTGTTDAGEPAFKWRKVVIDVKNRIATWSIDGLEIAKVDLRGLTLGGGNILFGHSDTNGGSSSDANSSLLNVTLIDNVQVVPEPGALALCLIGAIGLLVRRRRG